MGDWKETLFFWQGELAVDQAANQLTWTGAWSGVDAPGAGAQPGTLLCMSARGRRQCTSTASRTSKKGTAMHAAWRQISNIWRQRRG